MSSLYSHNHYKPETNICQRLASKLPSISPRTVQLLAFTYFTGLYLWTLGLATMYNYGAEINLQFYHIYYLIFFALILVVVLINIIKQNYCGPNSPHHRPIIIPMWLLAVTNAAIFFIGMISWFDTIGTFSLAHFTLILNQFTLMVIVIYSIYKTFFAASSTSGMFGGNYGEGGTHQQHYSLASTGDVDVDTDIELELDLYQPSDHYSNDYSGLASTSSSGSSGTSLQGRKDYTTGKDNSTTSPTTTSRPSQTAQQPKKLDIPVPDFNIDLAGEYTDLE